MPRKRTCSEGGAPGKVGVNCDPLVLIIQEPGTDVPDDNRDGGIIRGEKQNCYRCQF